MKRTLTALLLALVVACGAMALTACSKKESYSETFVGAVSETVYATKDDAAEAFIENEVSGLAFAAELVGYEKTEDLTEAQIDKLAIDEDLKEDIVAVEKVKVSYSTTNIARYTASAVTDSQNISVIYIYIITITPAGTTITEYRYYVPLAKNGDTLTKSYLDDLFDSSKYLNCTQSYNATTLAGISVGGYKIKVADDKASIVLDSTYSSTSNFSEGYFTQSGGTFKTYLKMNDSGTWSSNAILQVMSIGGTNTIRSMDQFATMCLPSNLDYSWFEKTDYGFKMKSELLSVYVADALREQGFSNADNVSTDFKVYVKEGRIYKITTSLSVKIAFITTKLSTEELTFSNFGTTVVETPEDFPY